MRKTKEIADDIIKLCDDIIKLCDGAIDKEADRYDSVFEQDGYGAMHSLAVMLQDTARSMIRYEANVEHDLTGNEGIINNTIKYWKDLGYELIYRSEKLKEGN